MRTTLSEPEGNHFWPFDKFTRALSWIFLICLINVFFARFFKVTEFGFILVALFVTYILAIAPLSMLRRAELVIYLEGERDTVEGLINIIQQPGLFWHYRPNKLASSWVLVGVPFIYPTDTGLVLEVEKSRLLVKDQHLTLQSIRAKLV
jgi:hypothetical protein